MVDFYKGTIPIIEDTPQGRDILHPQRSDIGYGYVERDYDKYPQEMFDPPSELKIFDESEWDALYDEQEEQKSSLEHHYLPDPNGEPAFINLDQNGHGYCWAYSTTQALMIKRLTESGKHNLKRLNPHSLAAIIKNGRDEGGWCGLSAKGLREMGVAEEGSGTGQWPLHSRNIQLYNSQQMKEEMAKNKVTEGWWDLTKAEYDQNLSDKTLATCGFCNISAGTDYAWWGHSVCYLRHVRIERGSWGKLILNSWKGWGRHGLAVLRGSQYNHVGAVAIRSANPNPKKLAA